MHLRRHSLTDQDASPSINPVTHSGRGTAVRVDGNGLQADRRNVVQVSRGQRIDAAPLDEEKTDLVHTQRLQVLARSGNDAGQHEEEWENDEGNFEELAGAPEAPVSAAQRTANLVMLGAAAALLVWAWRK